MKFSRIEVKCSQTILYFIVVDINKLKKENHKILRNPMLTSDDYCDSEGNIQDSFLSMYNKFLQRSISVIWLNTKINFNLQKVSEAQS